MNMRINDWYLFSDAEKLSFLREYKMKVPIPYFGGKSLIGKYLICHINNMAVQMALDENERNGSKSNILHKQDIFIDAFTGGGKMGASMGASGMFKTIIMNDIDYGIYSFYKVAQSDNYLDLIKTINWLCNKMDVELFHLIAYIRENTELDEVMAGAMTYLLTSCSFNSITSPDTCSYAATMKTYGERGFLDGVKAKANKKIPQLHYILSNSSTTNSSHYIIENLDYKELIKKYNGKPWMDLLGNLHDPIEEYKDKSKLWYFDEPYDADTMRGVIAPYSNSFPLSETEAIVEILSGSREKEFGEIKYFIRSNYDPKWAVEDALIQKSKNSKSYRRYTKAYNYIIDNSDTIKHKYDSIEDRANGFIKLCLGGFDRNVITEEDGRPTGYEYIWTHGFTSDYDKVTKGYEL